MQETKSAFVVGTQPYALSAHYLPRLAPEFYLADAVVFWTLPISNRQRGWLTDSFHAGFREMMLHAASREGLLCPAYCIMPDHLHLVWMGLRPCTDQRKAMKFLRAQLRRLLASAKFQHQAYDHVLTRAEREKHSMMLACTEYVLSNPVKAGLVEHGRDWRYLGAVIPGYPRVEVFSADYWPWFWSHYYSVLQRGIGERILPPRG